MFRASDLGSGFRVLILGVSCISCREIVVDGVSQEGALSHLCAPTFNVAGTSVDDRNPAFLKDPKLWELWYIPNYG